MFYDQTDYAIRFEWGAPGVDVLAACSDVVIIVDVLSFSTCVDIATARGAVILPYQWRDASAETYARENNALVASQTRRFDGEYSLAPTSLLTITPGTRLELPSPNGSTLTMRAATAAVTLTGCLRNAHAVAALARTLTGVLASVLGPLAEASVSILAISTFDTDYVLVKEESLARAVEVLRTCGHRVSVSGESAMS